MVLPVGMPCLSGEAAGWGQPACGGNLCLCQQPEGTNHQHKPAKSGYLPLKSLKVRNYVKVKMDSLFLNNHSPISNKRSSISMSGDRTFFEFWQRKRRNREICSARFRVADPSHLDVDPYPLSNSGSSGSGSGVQSGSGPEYLHTYLSIMIFSL